MGGEQAFASAMIRLLQPAANEKQPRDINCRKDGAREKSSQRSSRVPKSAGDDACDEERNTRD